jgi:hypothetical protein
VCCWCTQRKRTLGQWRKLVMDELGSNGYFMELAKMSSLLQDLAGDQITSECVIR